MKGTKELLTLLIKIVEYLILRYLDWTYESASVISLVGKENTYN